MSNGFIHLCSMVFCWAAISACHALLSSHMTNKDDDDYIILANKILQIGITNDAIMSIT